MKKLLLLFIPLVFFFGCEPEEENTDPSVGYNCLGVLGCVENNENPIYASLSACQSNCDVNSQGEEKTVYHEITISNNTVPGSFLHNSGLAMDYIYPTDPSGIVNGTYNTDENTVSAFVGSAASITVWFNFFPDGNYFGCLDVVIKTYVDEEMILENSITMGQISSNPNVYCSNFGNAFTYEFNL